MHVLTNRSARIRCLDLHRHAVRPTNTYKGTEDNHRRMQPICYHFSHTTLPPILVIMHPQIARQHDRQRRETKASRNRNQIVENRDRLGKDKRNTAQPKRTPEPRSPMHHRVRLQMSAVPQDTHEHVFSGDMQVQTGADDETNEADRIGRDLHVVACRAEGGRGDPFAAPAVDHEGEAEIRGSDEAHGEVDCFAVVLWLAHLGDDGEESGGSSG